MVNCNNSSAKVLQFIDVVISRQKPTSVQDHIHETKKYISNHDGLIRFATGFMIGCDNSSSPDIDLEAPTIFSTSPVDGENDVERNKTVTVTFNQAMIAETINNLTFTVEDNEAVQKDVFDLWMP